MPSTFLQPYITRKGTLVSADCPHCWTLVSCHEWATDNFNEIRDALEAGKAICPECGNHTDTASYVDHGRKYYAGRLSADGYLDCTDWEYDTNLRRLKKTLRDLNEGDE